MTLRKASEQEQKRFAEQKLATAGKLKELETQVRRQERKGVDLQKDVGQRMQEENRLKAENAALEHRYVKNCCFVVVLLFVAEFRIKIFFFFGELYYYHTVYYQIFIILFINFENLCMTIKSIRTPSILHLLPLSCYTPFSTLFFFFFFHSLSFLTQK